MIRKSRVEQHRNPNGCRFGVFRSSSYRFSAESYLELYGCYGFRLDGGRSRPIRRVRLVLVLRDDSRSTLRLNVTDRVPFPFIETGRGRSLRNF